MQTTSVNILIDKLGNILNAGSNILVQQNDVNGTSPFCLFNHQATLTFYDEIFTDSNGYKHPDFESAVTSGLSGTVTLEVYPDDHSPYQATLTPNNTINIATENVRTWIGKAAKLEFTTATVAGAEYINILIDRS